MCYRGSRGFSAIVPSCLRWYFLGPKFLSCVFVGLKFFLVGICGSEIFSRRYFVGLNFFLVGISLVLNIFSWVFCRSRLFSRVKFVSPIFFLGVYFVIQRFLVAGCMSKSDKNRNTEIHLKPRILFKSISTIANCLY